MDAPISEHSLHDQELEQIQWNNPREKLNPRNWPVWKKLFHAVVPCIVAFVITFGTSVNDAAVEILARKFDVSQALSMLTLTLYTLGLAFGPLAGARAASNLATLLICRELAGFFGSAQVALGAGTLADIWHLEKEGSPSSLFSILGMFLGPTVGSVAGAYALQDHHCEWRFTQWVMVRETLKEKILAKANTCEKAMSKKAKSTVGQLVTIGLGMLVKMLRTEVIVLLLTLYFASSSYVLSTYISVIVGHLLAAFMFGVFNKSLYANAREAGGGIAAPETFNHDRVSWSAVVCSGVPFGSGAFSLFLSTITYLVDVYKARAAASALAANGVIRYILGATFLLFTVQMYLFV
ncbi:major facilitator superfamily domain-containing protein [Aspergillus alliaceus]|uniref:major facilitator superfamily domain-containing protein n=1 Tax=Petromyces alliaceus TaxID=209559 RepID=UPI0012A5FE7D|nr:major facilitator superfamily domain-containing protein [Aspergillus alliaceus]KAB8228289.1 major facilitator superfamily domain-containing protein [Aspergillus alliaceus]